MFVCICNYDYIELGIISDERLLITLAKTYLFHVSNMLTLYIYIMLFINGGIKDIYLTTAFTAMKKYFGPWHRIEPVTSEPWITCPMFSVTYIFSGPSGSMTPIRKLNTAKTGARGHEGFCTFHYFLWTDSIKPSLQFSSLYFWFGCSRRIDFYRIFKIRWFYHVP